MEYKRKAKSREHELERNYKNKKTFKKFQLMPKFLKNVHDSFEYLNKPSLHSICSKKSGVKNFIFIEKSFGKSVNNSKRLRPMSSMSLLRKSNSTKRQKSAKNILVPQKLLQFKPSKSKLPAPSKRSLNDYHFSFDLENGVMKSVSVLCKL